MEELKSTEALDREILEDARKKAERTLRNADQIAEAAAAAWAKKADTEIAELERKHSARIAEYRKETFARLPLEKRRERVQRSERLVRRAMADYLGALPRDRLLRIVERELAERIGELDSSGLVVTASGFQPGEVERLLASILPEDSWSLAGAAACSETMGSTGGGVLPCLVIEGGEVRVRAGVESAAEALLQEMRAELAVALLGEGALND